MYQSESVDSGCCGLRIAVNQLLCFPSILRLGLAAFTQKPKITGEKSELVSHCRVGEVVSAGRASPWSSGARAPSAVLSTASIPEVISWSAWLRGCSLQPPGGGQEEGPRTRGPSPGEAAPFRQLPRMSVAYVTHWPEPSHMGTCC